MEWKCKLSLEPIRMSLEEIPSSVCVDTMELNIIMSLTKANSMIKYHKTS